MATIAELLEVKQADVEWDAWFTDKMSITHLALLEDHLLDYSQRSADDQCKNCMLWHCEKLKGYSIYEAPKFFDGDHESTYQKAGELAQAVQDSLGHLAQPEALDYAKKVRDLRYELIGYGVYDFTVAQEQEEIIYPEKKPKPLLIAKPEAPGLKGIIPPELAATKIQTRLVRSGVYDPAKMPVIKSPLDLQPFFSKMRQADQEWLVAIYTDNHLRVLGADEVTIGGRAAGIVPVDTILRGAILLNAGQIFLAHNHPSGDPTPSDEDKVAWSRVREAAKLFDIDVPEAMVVGSINDYSLAAEKIIPAPVKALQDRHIEELAAMKLLTKEIRDKLPPLYSQEKVQDPMVQVKFFTPDSNWTWYGIEFDGKDLFFGWVVGFEKEMGYFSLKELESARGPLGLPIERDKWFTPVRLSEVKKLHQQEVAKMTNELYRPAVFQKRMFGDEVYIFYKHAANDKQAFKTITELYQNWNLLAVASGDNDIWVLEKDASLIIDPEFLREHGAKLEEGIVAGAEMEQKREYEIRMLTATELRQIADIMDNPALPEGTEHNPDMLIRPKMFTAPSGKVTLEVFFAKIGLKTIQQLLQERTLLEQHQKDRPQDIIFFKDTIMKHYYPKEDFHPDSFRVVKPEPGVMVTLGCLKKDRWYPERLECVPTQTLHRTIVPRIEKYIKEAEEWEAVGVPAQHRETEVGIVPRELVEVISGS